MILDIPSSKTLLLFTPARFHLDLLLWRLEKSSQTILTNGGGFKMVIYESHGSRIRQKSSP